MPARICRGVKAGGFYGIFGFGNFFQRFDEVVYPQDLRNCGTCHQEDDPGTPQAGNWRITVNGTTCSSCHDDVNFTTGKNHGSRVPRRPRTSASPATDRTRASRT